MVTYLLLNLDETPLSVKTDVGQQRGGLIELMEDVVEAGDRFQKFPLSLEILTRKTGKKLEIRWRVEGED